MRHRKDGRKLSRTSSHRQMMMRNMVTSLLDHEKIQTTLAKAKEVRRLAERVIRLAIDGDLHARRQALAVLTDKGVVKKLFSEIGPRFRDRGSGFTRIVKLGKRLGDAAPVSMVMLTEPAAPGKREKKGADKAPAKKGKAPSTKAKGEKSKEKRAQGKGKNKAATQGESSEERGLPEEKRKGKRRGSAKEKKESTGSPE
ncbi:MAG: 50S ribosomal protein L17 [Deltaproteobacteria bacterium]|nr:50S ribosomal protein L17 [Deltaproteobacteria bacterium]